MNIHEAHCINFLILLLFYDYYFTINTIIIAKTSQSICYLS